MAYCGHDWFELVDTVLKEFFQRGSVGPARTTRRRERADIAPICCEDRLAGRDARRIDDESRSAAKVTQRVHMKANRIVFSMVALLACSTAPVNRTASEANPLVGTWRLISVTRTVLDTGETTDLFGKSPSGYITYGADGHMQVLLVREGRPKPADLQKLTDADRASLFKTMTAYAGTYSFDGKTVTHHIEVSWNENWTGTDQKRDVQLEGNRVTLTTHPAPNSSDGQMSVSRLVWERVEPASH